MQREFADGLKFDSATVSNPHGYRATINLDKLEGIIIGIALGDSLGLPVETMTSEAIAGKFDRVTGFLAYDQNPFLKGSDLPIGSYSDDAQLTAAIFEAYCDAGGYSFDAIVSRHVSAYRVSRMGWGGSTRAGVEAVMAGFEPGTAEFARFMKSGTGNGIPMKIAAVAAWAAHCGQDLRTTAAQVAEICSLSHPTPIAAASGVAHCAALEYCLGHTPSTFNSREFIEAVIHGSELGHSYFNAAPPGDNLTARLKELAEVSSLGPRAIIDKFGGGDCYVFNSLPFSYAFFLRGPANPETLFEVINAGGDTDSNGAIVGGLQGALMGSRFFPDTLVASVHGLPELLAIVERFFSMLPGRGNEL